MPPSSRLLPPGVPGSRGDHRRPDRAAAAPRARRSAAALRVARQLTLERLAVLDVEEGAPLADITLAMTELAEATLELALARTPRRPGRALRRAAQRRRRAHRLLDHRHGQARRARAQRLVRHRPDLRLRGTTATTDGARPVSAHEYFAQVARSLYSPDRRRHRGRLRVPRRPGAAAERQLRARRVQPGDARGLPPGARPRVGALRLAEEPRRRAARQRRRAAGALALRSLVTAFVYRRYLDYGVFEGLRQLHAKVRDEAQRRAAGRPRARQRRQAVARRHPRDRVHRPAAAGGARRPVPRDPHPLDPEGARQAGRRRPDEARQPPSAWPTPTRCCAGSSTASSTSTTSRPTCCRTRRRRSRPGSPRSLGADGERPVRAARPARRGARVRRRRIRPAAARRPAAATATAAAAAARRRCRSMPRPSSRSCPPELRGARVRPLCDQPKIRMLRDESKVRLGRPGGARRAGGRPRGAAPLQAAVQFVDWIEPLLRRESYLALLAERPEVQNRLLRLLGLARWPMRYLMLHPGVIDELADEQLLHGRFDPAAYKRELEERHAGWQRSEPGRRGAAARHLAPRPPRRGVPHPGARRRGPHHGRAGRRRPVGAGRRDALLRPALGLEAPEDRRIGREPQLAVIAYGKLGGKELGYGSDLDVVFVYDDPRRAPTRRPRSTAPSCAS